MQPFWQRTAQVAKDATVRVLRMSGADLPDRSPRTLFTFNSAKDLQGYVLGCDSDIGGYSTANLTLTENDSPPSSSSSSFSAPTARFWGTMNLSMKPEYAHKYKAGYAGFRNKLRPHLFGPSLLTDISQHTHLTLRVRVSGEPHTHNSYYVNIRTPNSVTSTDIWQHRLYFRTPEKWEDVHIPIQDFVHTNKGHLTRNNLSMWTERIQSIGLSFLGGNNNVQGDYQLGIDSIRIVNPEDVLLDGSLPPVPECHWK